MKFQDSKIATALREHPTQYPGQNLSSMMTYFREANILWEAVDTSEYLCCGRVGKLFKVYGYKGNPKTQQSTAFGCAANTPTELFESLRARRERNKFLENLEAYFRINKTTQH